MIQGNAILALIPARTGSKGLPGKNVRPLLGKPLISWTIEQALACRAVDRVVVSTDSEEIAEVAKKYGAEVPFLRPVEMAGDDSPRMDAVFHALDFFEQNGERYDCLALLECTSPLRDAEDIESALQKLVATEGAESIVSVAPVGSAHPEFLLSVQGEFIAPYAGDFFEVKRRQEIEPLYFFDGSLYIARVDSLRKRGEFYHSATLPYIVSKYKSFEIDDLEDFKIVETLLAAKQKGSLP